MRFAAFLSILLLGLFIFISCQRELSFENGNTGISNGTLKSTSGDCLPSGQDGVFKKGVTLDSSNSIYVDINVFTAGSYKISSDTINGMYFKSEGVFDTIGLQTVRLIAYGMPITNGTVPYNITYHNQTCAIIVFISDMSTTVSAYYFTRVNTACSVAVLNGSYKTGVAMTATNTVTVELTVINTGTYNISTTTANGVTFSGAGSFAATGTQQLTLTATGVPATAGSYNFSVSGDINACSFQVTF